MFGKKKKKKKKTTTKQSKNVGTIISSGTSIEGIIKVMESIRIDGQLKGELIVDGDIYIGKKGRLEANIQGDNVMIAGEVEGNIKASGKLEIVETGKLIGDISISNLIIHDGATFQGNSTSKEEIDQKILQSKKNRSKVEGDSKKSEDKKNKNKKGQ